MLRLITLTASLRARLAAATLTGLVAAGLLAGLAPLTGHVVDQALRGSQGGVLLGGLLAAGLVVAHLVALWLAQWWFADVSASLGAVLRDRVVGRLEQAPLDVVEARDSDDLLARAGSEVDDLAEFVTSQLPALLIAAGYLVTSVVVLLGHSVPLTLVLLAAYLPVATVVLVAFRRRAHDAFESEAAQLATLSGVVAEGAALAGALRQPESSSWWAERVRWENERLTLAIRRTVHALNLFPLLLAVEAIAVAAILLVGVRQIGAGAVGVPTLTVFLVASATLFATFGQLAGALAALAPALAQARRHVEVVDALRPLDTDPAVVTDTGVTMRGLDFAYPGRAPVLRDVSVTFPPGSRSVVVGPSGAGKTTLAKLLAGLYLPTSGTVEVGGVPAAAARLEHGAAAVLLVTQATRLLPGTVRDNLLPPPATSEPDVARAVRALGLEAWLAALGGLERRLTPYDLDAGDLQRLALLRVALRSPAVLVVDEATASLDERDSTALHDHLDRLEHLAGTTVVVVAHHDATIRRYDRVVTVHDDGHVTLTGPGGAPCPTSAAASSH